MRSARFVNCQLCSEPTAPKSVLCVAHNRERRREYNQRYQAANKEKIQVKAKAWIERNKERIRGYRQKKYAANAQLVLEASRRRNGFTPEMIEALRKHQGGKCAMPGCEVELHYPFVAGKAKECGDHCHRTGQPRGLLCSPCNVALGGYEKLGERAAAYLSDTPVSRLGLCPSK